MDKGEGKHALMEAEMNEIDTKAISFKRLVLFTDKLLLSGYIIIIFINVDFDFVSIVNNFEGFGR